MKGSTVQHHKSYLRTTGGHNPNAHHPPGFGRILNQQSTSTQSRLLLAARISYFHCRPCLIVVVHQGNSTEDIVHDVWLSTYPESVIAGSGTTEWVLPHLWLLLQQHIQHCYQGQLLSVVLHTHVQYAGEYRLKC